ncbi:MAG: rhodanese-like domain-containing protein, partial [Bacteroides sp.]|nr:rhodanese-like domain-containing protein [Bacteroides sp.]
MFLLNKGHFIDVWKPTERFYSVLPNRKIAVLSALLIGHLFWPINSISADISISEDHGCGAGDRRFNSRLTEDKDLIVSLNDFLTQKIKRHEVLKNGYVHVPKPSNDRVLVDVRHSTAYDKVRIPGSINIPAAALTVKPFLKKKLIVLIGEGYEVERLLKLKSRLEQAGFQRVSLLEGGITGWHQVGQSLEGNPFAINTLGVVTPLDIRPELKYSDWSVIEVPE